MGEYSWIVQTGQPGGYKQNQRQKRINAHVARFSNSRRMMQLAERTKSEIQDTQGLRKVRVVRSEEGNSHGNYEPSSTRPSPRHLADKSATVVLCRSPAGSWLDDFACFTFPRNTEISRILHFLNWYVVVPITTDALSQCICIDPASLAADILSKECRAYAALSIAAHLHAVVTGHSSSIISASMFRDRAIKALRYQLSVYGFGGESAAAMFALATAEIWCGDAEAAAVHIRYLESHVQPVNGPITVSTPRISQVLLCQDVRRASRLLTKPQLDLEEWQRVNKPMQWPKCDILQALLEEYPPIDSEAIVDVHLLHLLTSVRKHGAVLGAMTKSRNTLIRNDLIAFVNSLVLDSGQLVEYYLDHASHLRSLQLLLSMDHFDELQQAAAALAGIYWIRLITRDDAIVPVNAHQSDGTGLDPNVTLFDHLRRIMEATEDVATGLLIDFGLQHIPGCLRSNRIPPSLRLRLWVLHVGTHIEKAIQSCETLQYHHNELERLITGLDLELGSETYLNILQGFLPINEQLPFAPAWVSRKSVPLWC